jgi:hypothetical protein
VENCLLCYEDIKEFYDSLTRLRMLFMVVKRNLDAFEEF